MKKKNGFKFWLAGILRKWANMLEPEMKEDVFKVEHVYVPLVTLNANLTIPKGVMSDERIEEILSHKIGDEISKYMRIDTSEYNDFNFDDRITYRATVRVADDEVLR